MKAAYVLNLLMTNKISREQIKWVVLPENTLTAKNVFFAHDNLSAAKSFESANGGEIRACIDYGRGSVYLITPQVANAALRQFDLACESAA